MKPLSMSLQIFLVVAIAASGWAVWINHEYLVGRIGLLSQSSDKIVKKPGTNKKARKKQRKLPVIIAQVGRKNNDETIAAVGTGRARRSITIYAKSDGIITSFGVKAGGRIHKGDMVFQLDDTKAGLDVQIARKRLDEAALLLKRSQFLKQQSVSSDAKVVDANTTYERTLLELQQAEKTARDLRVKAPFDGILGIPKVEVGDRISDATPVVSLDDRNELLIEFEIPEKYLSRIAIGDHVKATTPSYARQRISGRIAYIDSRIDPKARTVMIRATLPNQDDRLRPGMSFAVEIDLPGKPYPAVPELALQWRKGKSYVWIVRNHQAHKIFVENIKRLNNTILVAGELETGDLIVIEGVQRLRPGSVVTYSLPDTIKSTSPAKTPKTPLGQAGKES